MTISTQTGINISKEWLLNVCGGTIRCDWQNNMLGDCSNNQSTFLHIGVWAPLHPWWWWWPISHRRGFGERWWSVLACLLVAVKSDSWCTDPTALQTGEDLGWEWLECCSFFLPPVSFVCGVMPLFQTYDWLFSLMSANCLSLRPPAP